MVSTFTSRTTSKASIRIATPADAAFIAAIENDPELKRLVGGVTGRTEEDYRKALEASPDLKFLIVESNSGVSIGVCGLLTYPKPCYSSAT